MPDPLYVIGVQGNGYFHNYVAKSQDVHGKYIPINQQNYHKGYQRKAIYLRFRIVYLYLFQNEPRYSLLDKVVTINIVHKLDNHIGIYNFLHICSR